MHKNKTTFHRKRKENNFTIIDNEVIQRNDLSWKAKGIMVYIFSLPDSWNINMKEVMRHATDGEASFRSGWKELTDAGYVERKPVRDKDSKKITHWQTYIYESVDMKASEPHSENQDVGNQYVGNQDVDNRNLLSTKGTKDLDIQSTDKDSPAKAERIPYKDIIDYLNKKTGRNFNHSAKGNKDIIRARWNEGYDLEDFKQAIDNKVAHASDPNHWFTEEYLRPSTLFRPTNFDEYVNAVTGSKNERSVDGILASFLD